MNKWYFGFPLIALVAFALFFWQFNRRHEAELAREAAAVKEERAAELRQQMQARLEAAQAAKKTADENRRVREEEKAREEAERVARQEAIARRDDVASNLAKSRRLLDAARSDLTAEEERLKKIRDENSFLLAEKTFLTDYIKRAEGNATRMLALVEKIDTAAAKVVAELEAAKASGSKK